MNKTTNVGQTPGEELDIERIKEMPPEELFRVLETSTEGLSVAEAGKRLEQYGPNSLPEKKINPLMKFLRGGGSCKTGACTRHS